MASSLRSALQALEINLNQFDGLRDTHPGAAVGALYNAVRSTQAALLAVAESIEQITSPAPVADPVPEPVDLQFCCDWCGYKTTQLATKPTIDGSSGNGRGYHLLCRRCVARYNQEAREYQAKHKASAK